MSVVYNDVKDFWNFLVYYPDEDEPGFDGIHYGGIKGVRDDAPEKAVRAYERFVRQQNEAKKNGIKL